VNQPQGEIVLDSVTKSFAGVTVVDDLSLKISGGEFFSMLGPSGCGKTTTLRMIAGFENPDQGSVRLDGLDITKVGPASRNMNMVFQSYGLFPHMTVAENVGFGPKIKRRSRSETRRRVAEAIRTVQLEGLHDRRPTQLSGGQQQRVALARALVNQPAALLLDEPLGALDLKLRREMQLELKSLQQQTGTTFVYVTHDQEEAMTMSDRIAILNNGVIEQVAAPKKLYQQPATRFVAEFVGTSNVLTMRVDRRDDGCIAMDLGDGQRILAREADATQAATVTITIRPEWIRISDRECDGRRSSRVQGTLLDVTYLGSVTHYLVLLPTQERLSVHRLNDTVETTDPRPGDRVTLQWAAEHSYIIAGAPIHDPPSS
jgi:spermidine/putrescine transport system ATP-binding protein